MLHFSRSGLRATHSQEAAAMNPFGNPQKLMKQFQQAQERLQAEMAAISVEATAGGGMVKVVLDGQKNVRSVHLDPEVVNKDDVEMLQDLLTAAFNEATRKVDDAVREKLGGTLGGLKIPGLF
jgi:nucleoid-associated protein EbfC